MEGRGECAAEEYYLCRPWWYKCFYAVSHEDNRGRLNEKKKKQDKYLFYLLSRLVGIVIEDGI